MASAKGKRVYRTARWRRLRLEIFARDGWKCVLCGRRAGLECDHKTPIAKGGDWYDPDNLRTVCRRCHITETAKQNAGPVDPERAALIQLARGAES